MTILMGMNWYLIAGYIAFYKNKMYINKCLKMLLSTSWIPKDMFLKTSPTTGFCWTASSYAIQGVLRANIVLQVLLMSPVQAPRSDPTWAKTAHPWDHRDPSSCGHNARRADREPFCETVPAGSSGGRTVTWLHAARGCKHSPFLR